ASGMTFSLTKGARLKTVSATMLGLGLLLYGSNLVTSSASGLQQSSWFAELVRLGHGLVVVSFFIGVLASLVTQSTTAVVLLAVALSSTGLVGIEESLMMVYGANVGSTVARIAITRERSGAVIQITRFQDLLKLTGGALFVGLFYVEYLGG